MNRVLSYWQKPENKIKEKLRKQSLAYKKQQQEYYQRPDVKQRVTLYNQKHNQIPEIKEKLIAYKHEWYIKKQGILLARSRQYQSTHKELIAATKKAYYEKNRTEIRSVEKRRLLKVRIQLMQVLGGVSCKNCGFDVYEALQFDHINGGGCQDRRKWPSGRIMYQFYTNNPELARRILQVLCANCNFIKRHISEGELN